MHTAQGAEFIVLPSPGFNSGTHHPPAGLVSSEKGFHSSYAGRIEDSCYTARLSQYITPTSSVRLHQVQAVLHVPADCS